MHAWPFCTRSGPANTAVGKEETNIWTKSPLHNVDETCVAIWTRLPPPCWVDARSSRAAQPTIHKQQHNNERIHRVDASLGGSSTFRTKTTRCPSRFCTEILERIPVYLCSSFGDAADGLSSSSFFVAANHVSNTWNIPTKTPNNNNNNKTLDVRQARLVGVLSHRTKWIVTNGRTTGTVVLKLRRHVFSVKKQFVPLDVTALCWRLHW